jgi:mono/diheme cytochrome c family protein
MSHPNRKKIKIVKIVVIAVCAVLLVVVGVFLRMESTWVKPQTLSKEEAFLRGSTGTEIMPLSVFKVLPVMFPENFQPAGVSAGDWVEQFGFTRGQPGVNEGLPMGFSVSNYRPKSGAPSPVSFVGFSCSMCHTSQLRPPNGKDPLLIKGMGNASVDFIAWVDAVRSSILDERLSADSIAEAYQKTYNESLGMADRAMIAVWLPGSRGFFQDNLAKYDAPFSGKDLRDSNLMPNGPARTQPFRNLVRIVLDRPATSGDSAYCKVPTLYEQGNRHWGQYDGSVGDRLSRSVLAAIATGATIDNLIVPEIGQGVIGAVDYTVDLKGPRYQEIFADEASRVDPQKVERGQKVYMQSCAECHGYRNESTGVWEKGKRTGEVVPGEEIKTDAERINFRYNDTLTDALYGFFPDGHPLRPKREDMRPGPAGTTKGYINAPIESVFARAPYLHNGSVLTLAELINLKPRRNLFFRGQNIYDPVDVGLSSPDQPTTTIYYRFDTRVRGNSNAGHDYPWAYQGPGWNQANLEDLLEYLKMSW